MTAKRKDLYPDLPDEVKKSINLAKAELDNGEGIPHEEVIQDIKKRVLKNIKEAIEESKFVQSGKLKTLNAEDLFDEP